MAMERETLLDMNNGERAEISEIKCEGQTGRRLMSFGIVPGRVVTCVDKIPRGPMILRFHELKIAIGRRTASMCMCRSCKSERE